LSRATIVEYNKIIGEEPLALPIYLSGISRQKLLSLGAHFLGFNPKNEKNLDYEAFLDNFFSPENSQFKDAMHDKLLKFHEAVGTPILIVNTVSSLEFFQFVFSRPDQPETQQLVEMEQNIFRAYLSINQETRSKEDKVLPSVKGISIDEALPAAFFTQSFAYSNLINFELSELVTSQLIKAVFLFDFLSQTDKTKILYQAFLDYFKLQKGTDYLVRLFSFIHGIITNQKEGYVDFVVPGGDKFERDCEFIEKLIMAEGSMADADDFINIRERPFYRIDKGKYRIVFSLFVIEKVFKSLYFTLKSINESLEKENRVKGLRPLLTEELSEKIIVYEILNSIYKKNYITYTGKDLRDLDVTAEPDYYLRKGKRIFLFESKDFLIEAGIKTSYDYSRIRPKLEQNFLKDDKGKKAILQLLNTCEKILSKTFHPDVGYEEHKVIIYPIVVVHDNQYNVIGLNHIVNTWLNDELLNLKKRGVPTDLIRPLTIINIDTLIYHQDLLRLRNVLLEDVIERYITRCSLQNVRYKSENHRIDVLQKRMNPFSHFFNEDPIVIAKNSAPCMLKDKVGILLKN
jgi:hypothetical protein